MMTKRIALVATLVAAVAGPGSLSAQTPVFNGGLPQSGNCVGNCGTAGQDGDVLLSGLGGPGFSTGYGWVSTAPTGQNNDVRVNSNANGIGLNTNPNGTPGQRETNGSRWTYNFNTIANSTQISFRFNYVTSEGSAVYPDYAYARLNGPDNTSYLLFTARTVPSGNTVPGQNLPAGLATIGGNTPITPGAPNWSPLGVLYNNSCFAPGCGSTGWVSASYSVASIGAYSLEFGVTNYADNNYDSGLAFDFQLVNDIPNDPNAPTAPTNEPPNGGGGGGGGPPPEPEPGVVPEPSTYALMLAGLAGMAVAARRRRRAA